MSRILKPKGTLDLLFSFLWILFLLWAAFHLMVFSDYSWANLHMRRVLVPFCILYAAQAFFKSFTEPGAGS